MNLQEAQAQPGVRAMQDKFEACPHCSGKKHSELTYSAAGKDFCSAACRDAATGRVQKRRKEAMRNENFGGAAVQTPTCDYCGKQYKIAISGKAVKGRFCSDNCYREAQSKPRREETEMTGETNEVQTTETAAPKKAAKKAAKKVVKKAKATPKKAAKKKAVKKAAVKKSRKAQAPSDSPFREGSKPAQIFEILKDGKSHSYGPDSEIRKISGRWVWTVLMTQLMPGIKRAGGTFKRDIKNKTIQMTR